MPEAINFLISMAVTFFAFSVMVSGVAEVWSAMRGTRGEFLWRGIRRMIGTGPTADAINAALRAHPSLRALSQNDRATSLPSYIPANLFASALCDVILRHGDSTGLDNYGPAEAIAGLPEDLMLKRILQTAWRRAQGDTVQFELEIGKVFDMSMDRVSGWYKRNSQARSVIIGLIMALALNVNAVHIGAALWNDQKLAQSVADQAATITQQYAAQEAARPAANPAPAGQVVNLMPTQLPVGWPARWFDKAPAEGKVWHWGGVLLGFLIMAASCLVGAPLWYQLLTMLMPLRSTGPVPACGRAPAHHEYDGVAGPPLSGNRQGPPAPVPAVREQGSINSYEAQLLKAGELQAIQDCLRVPQTGMYDLATRIAIQEEQGRRGFVVTGQLTRLLADQLIAQNGLAAGPAAAGEPVAGATAIA